MNDTQFYYTHYNKNRPFKVIIDKNNNISVHKIIKNSKDYDVSPIIEYFKPEEYFVGTSPRTEMTTCGKTYGYDFDGNSILLHSSNLDYVCISDAIFSFLAYAKITIYISPVRSNDVPYPYAVDVQKNIYLLSHNVVILMNDKIRVQIGKYDDPYNYYYRYSLITTNNDISETYKIKNFKNINKFFIGNKEIILTYTPFPEKTYDKFTSNGIIPLYIEEIDMDDSCCFRNTRLRKRIISKIEFVELIEDFAAVQSFVPLLNVRVLYEKFL